MVYFTDFFNISENDLEEYGAFNISLINDLPLFIDPFLLFGSDKEEYQELHNQILQYLAFLKDKSEKGANTNANIKSWYTFSEVKQNWLGYSQVGNKGSGLGPKFGQAMSANMHIIFDDLFHEQITTTSHIEKAALFQIGVGRDNISDFTCNLIKGFLAKYTEKFGEKYLSNHQLKNFKINKAYFDYECERWMPQSFKLPMHEGDFILLTPKDILTKDDNWINKNDLTSNFKNICSSLPNDQLRAEILNYFRNKLPPSNKKKKPSQKELSYAINETINNYPEILKYYIKSKEENKVGAKNISNEKVKEVEKVFIENVKSLIQSLESETNFYKVNEENSYQAALKRVHFLKDVIENKDGYKLFYVSGEPIKREEDLQLIYRLTWHSSTLDVNREVNNGRGPVDFTISKGSDDKTILEFKLAKNSKLKQNLENQVSIYEKSSNPTKPSIKVILYFNEDELNKVNKILNELSLQNDENIILIDACYNKLSASNVM